MNSVKMARWVVAAVLLVSSIGGAVTVVRTTVLAPLTITAVFSTATSVYPGDDVRVAGVKVGSIAAVEPQGTQSSLTLKVDRDVPIPADAKAVIVAENLISARFVQLTPAYVSSGPTLNDGATIPLDRTAVPVEWDDVKQQLTRLASELGPRNDVSTPATARFIDSAADAMAGNGGKLRETLAQLSGVGRILADGSGDIVGVIKNLQILISALRDSSTQIVVFQNNLATLSSVLNESRSDLDAALTNVSEVVGRVQNFIHGTRDQAADQIRMLADVTTTVVERKRDLEQILHVAPTAIANTLNMFDPRDGGATGIITLANFSNPVQFICGAIGAIENTTAPETAKLCSQYLGPALSLLNMNALPAPINPLLTSVPGPEDIVYTEPKLMPGADEGPEPPETPPAVSAYTGAGDVPPPPGYGPPAPPAATAGPAGLPGLLLPSGGDPAGGQPQPLLPAEAPPDPSTPAAGTP